MVHVARDARNVDIRWSSVLIHVYQASLGRASASRHPRHSRLTRSNSNVRRAELAGEIPSFTKWLKALRRTVGNENLPRGMKARRYFIAVVGSVGLRCANPTYKS